MVTSGTYDKQHLCDTPEKLTRLQDRLFELAAQYGWLLQAWAVFSNHYHFIALAPSDPKSLQTLVRHLHSVTARALNQADGTPGRKVWFQYWDSHITYENSYRARLNYVHRNPVHHGLVRDPSAYAWCSAGWFERTAAQEYCKAVSGFPIGKLKVRDDF
jgi:putative transposase